MRRLTRVVLFLSGAAACSAAPPASVPRPGPDPARIGAVLDGLSPAVEAANAPPVRYALKDRLTAYHTPGIVIAVIRGDTVAWVYSTGVRKAGSADSMTAGTHFIVQSIHKPVTAYGTMRLVDQRLIDLDRPVDDYLTRWHVPQNALTAQAQPTVREILSHTAGFSVRGVQTYTDSEPLPSVLQALDALPPAKPPAIRIEYVPGTEQRYSGGGYTVLQVLLEDATRSDFSDLMKRLVLDPLAMSNSRFVAGMPAEWQSRAAAGHNVHGAPIPGNWARMAAGGFVSTAPDLARFVVEVGRAWRGESRLMSRQTARSMLSPQRFGWGLGFEVAGTGDSMSFSHTGSGGGFRTLIIGYPAAHSGVVILANSDAANELRYEIVRSLAREYHWPGALTERRATAVVSEAARRQVLGRYVFSDSSIMQVFERDGAVWTQWKEEIPQRMFPSSEAAWFAENATTFTFSGSSPDGFLDLEWGGDFGGFKAHRVK